MCDNNLTRSASGKENKNDTKKIHANTEGKIFSKGCLHAVLYEIP